MAMFDGLRASAHPISLGLQAFKDYCAQKQAACA